MPYEFDREYWGSHPALLQNYLQTKSATTLKTQNALTDTQTLLYTQPLKNFYYNRVSTIKRLHKITNRFLISSDKPRRQFYLYCKSFELRSGRRIASIAADRSSLPTTLPSESITDPSMACLLDN